MNWQNFPEEAKRAVVPKRGSFSMFDYSQIEPRFFAYYTAMPPVRDPTVANWYREGRDVYREIAGRVFSKAPEAVTDDERQLGKVWFLMSLYGAGPQKMSEEIGMTLKEAKAFYKDFHAGLPMLKALSNPEPSRPDIPWIKGAIEAVYYSRREQMPDGSWSGYLQDPYGRHLHAEQWGEYKLLNKLIQGSAAGMMKASILRVYRWIRAHREIESRMVSNVHDEILLDGPEHELTLLHENVPVLMCDEPWFAAVVPLRVDHEVALTSWAEKIDYDEWKELHGNSHNRAA